MRPCPPVLILALALSFPVTALARGARTAQIHPGLRADATALARQMKAPVRKMFFAELTAPAGATMKALGRHGKSYTDLGQAWKHGDARLGSTHAILAELEIDQALIIARYRSALSLP